MKLANINRDYMVIIDVKSGSVNKPTMVFYNTDKNTSNIYAQLVVKETIVAATPIENATDFAIELKVVKPGNVVKFMDGVLVNEAEAIYEFDLPEDFTNLSGNYDIEFWVKAKVNNRDEMITSSKAKYTVKPSILTDLDEAIEDHEDYPLFLKLMEEVKVINETAHELDTTIRTLQSDMIEANNEMKANEEERKANEVLRETNEANRIAQENARQEYLNAFDGKWEEYKANTDADIADYKAQINEQEAVRNTQEQQRQANEQRRITNEDERKIAERQRKANENVRITNEKERKSAEQSRVSAENARVTNEEIRQTNEANRETAEEIRKANEEARITAETVRVTEHEQMRTELNEVKAENTVLMENDKKIADRMTQVEISDKRQYVIMEGLMNSAGDGYLKIEDTGNDTTLYNSVEGFVDVKNVTGNTMVNSIKNPDDELTLNADINTSGQSVTLTTAVDNGQVDVLAEGNTMVNVCDQQEAVAITKSYTVENGNHIALQGEFDGKARPVVYGNTLVNLISDNYTMNGCTYSNNNFTLDLSNSGYVECKFNLVYNVKPATDYTCIFNIIQNDSKVTVGGTGSNELGVFSSNISSTGLKVLKITTSDSIVDGNKLSFWSYAGDVENGSIIFSKPILLEGDYTNKPIPDYFTGMKSSFEDKLVTQEMVDSGKELAENLGKYRVDYKVTGKNKLYYIGDGVKGSINIPSNTNVTCKLENDGSFTLNGTVTSSNSDLYIMGMWNKNKVYLNKGVYTLSVNQNNSPSNFEIYLINKDNSVGRLNTNEGYSTTINCKLGITAVLLRLFPGTYDNVNFKIQIEEGSTATAYEPYKEFTKTYYLNSPLLEGDTIEESNGNVYHVHRRRTDIYNGSENWILNKTLNGGAQFILHGRNYSSNTKEVICDKILSKYHESDTTVIWVYNGSVLVINSTITNLDDFKTWLQANPISVVYELASPTKELISQSDTILTDSYVAGHLDFDTAVPVEKVEFNRPLFKLKYTYPNVEYNIQFESDNIGTSRIALGNVVIDTPIVKGINKFNITTSENNNPTLYMSGIGFSASNIVVTEATDKDFGYFSGMKSVGELEENKIEILSSTNDTVLKNIETYGITLPNELSDTFIDGVYTKKVGKFIVNEKTDFVAQQVSKNTNTFRYSIKITGMKVRGNNDSLINSLGDTLPYLWGDQDTIHYKVGIAPETLFVYIPIEYKDKPNEYFKENPFTLYYELSTPIEFKLNKKQILLNEPLRAVGDAKDRFVQIDGKWYVERNCAEVVLDGSESGWGKSNVVYNSLIISTPMNSPIVCDKLKNINSDLYDDSSYNSKMTIAIHRYVDNELKIKITDSDTTDSVKQWLADNPTKITYILKQPTYEPVEISPVLNTYTDVTHITNNSTIPMNMPVVNSGYEVIVKPSTKYTVVGMTNGRIGNSTIVNGTITTPATLTDPFLRPYGTGKTSKVMLLEGEPANIPGYFKGIKSVFEDKVTEEGKYAVEVKVVGKNKCNNDNNIIGNLDINTGNFSNHSQCIVSDFIKVSEPYVCSCVSDKIVNPVLTYRYYDINKKYLGTDKPSFYPHYVRIRCLAGFTISKDYISFQLEEGTVATEYEPYHETKQTLYLDEPLYNTNNITIYNDKLGYWKNWDKVVLDGSDDEGWVINNSDGKMIDFRRQCTFLQEGKVECISDRFHNYDLNSIERLVIGSRNVYIRISKGKLQTQDLAGFKQYLSENPVTVVYQLAEPVFVPLIDNCPNWVIGSWDNCSIHFDSIIPLKDTRYRYTGNVPSVMAMSEDVATTKSISDEQDLLLVDMATELAVIKLTM